MENANLLIAFIAVTAAAAVVQACMLIGMYLAMRKSSARMEALATEVKGKVLPTVEAAHSMLLDLRPKVESIIENTTQTSTMVRAQMQRIDATLNDAIDRARLQVIRADELINRTMDRVEETTDIVHRTVTSPVRKLSGVFQGVSAGVEYFLGSKRRNRQGVSVPQDEMFI